MYIYITAMDMEIIAWLPLKPCDILGPIRLQRISNTEKMWLTRTNQITTNYCYGNHSLWLSSRLLRLTFTTVFELFDAQVLLKNDLNSENDNIKENINNTIFTPKSNSF